MLFSFRWLRKAAVVKVTRFFRLSLMVHEAEVKAPNELGAAYLSVALLSRVLRVPRDLLVRVI